MPTSLSLSGLIREPNLSMFTDSIALCGTLNYNQLRFGSHWEGANRYQRHSPHCQRHDIS